MTISWKSLWRIFLMLMFVAALFLLRDTLMILGLALVISSALNAPINFLEKQKIPRVLSALTIYILLIAVAAALVYILTPAAMMELKDFSAILNRISVLSLRGVGSAQLIKNFAEGLNRYAATLFSGSASFFDLISTIFGGAIFVLAVFILALYLSLSRDGVERFLRAILPLNYEDYAIDLYRRVRGKMSLWLGGQLILSLTIGVAVFLGLLILGINYSLILGITAGILEMVPFAGPIIAGIITFFIAASQSWSLAISAVILFTIIQQLEAHILIPLVMKKMVGLHPVIIVVALLAGGQLAGLTGTILAVPAAIVIYEILEDWAVKKGRREF